MSFLWFLNQRLFDKFIQFKGCIKSVSYCFYCFNGFTDSQLKSVAIVWQCVKKACDSVSFIFSKNSNLESFSKEKLWGEGGTDATLLHPVPEGLLQSGKTEEIQTGLSALSLSTCSVVHYLHLQICSCLILLHLSTMLTNSKERT